MREIIVGIDGSEYSYTAVEWAAVEAQRRVAHVPCPVMVVQHPSLSLVREVVVGVDRAEGNRSTIEFAFAEAARGSRLRAVHTWVRPDRERNVVPLAYSDSDVQDEEERLLAESLAGCAARYPDVRVIEKTLRSRVVPGAR